MLLSLVSLRALPPLAWQRTVAVALHAACPLLLLAAMIDLGLLLLVYHTGLQPQAIRQGPRQVCYSHVVRLALGSRVWASAPVLCEWLSGEIKPGDAVLELGSEP